MARTAEKIEVLRDSAALRGVDDGGANARIMAEITRLGLERNVRDLDDVGYTVLMPEQVGRGGFADKVLATILDIAERETGSRPSVEGGDSFGDQIAPLGRGTHFPEILFADPIFEQVVMTEAPLALITYLLGESCELAAMNAVIKAAGDEYLALHVDTPQPSPLPPYSQVANATWILTDYDAENGATVMLPGSHKLCRHPVGDDVTDFSDAVTIEAPAGSVLIWHGNVWHGALPRKAPGVRVSLITYFTRHYLRRVVAGFPLSQPITEEMLARNSERFAILTNRDTLEADEHWYTRRSQFA